MLQAAAIVCATFAAGVLAGYLLHRRHVRRRTARRMREILDELERERREAILVKIAERRYRFRFAPVVWFDSEAERSIGPWMRGPGPRGVQ